MYVVNSFFISENGFITDHGHYENIKNLTDLTQITKDNDKIQFETTDEQFFYQGKLMEKRLPWNIEITYFLDDQEIHSDQLAGKSGDLSIKINTSENKEVDSVFFEHYLLQISLTLDPLIFSNIQAPKGTELNEGKNKQITFSILPDKEETLIISATVEQLALDPINITAVPANILIDEPDTEQMTDDIKTLSEAIAEVNTGVAKLKSGINDFRQGVHKIKDGSNLYKDGLNDLNQSSSELVSGSEQFLNGLKQIQKALDNDTNISPNDLSELVNLPAGLREITKELDGFASVLNELETLIKQIPDNTVTEKDMKKLYQTLEITDNKETIGIVRQLEATYQIAQAIKQFNAAIPGKLGDGPAVIAKQLNTIANNIEAGLQDLQQLNDLTELQAGLKTITSEYGKLHNGLVTYTDGVQTLTSKYNHINNGLHELATGIDRIYKGIGDLHDGTTELNNSTKTLPDEMESEINKMLEDYDHSDFTPVSFVSKNNKGIGIVQFVLQTEKIELEEEEVEVDKQVKEKNFWDRFLDLFK